MLMGRGSLTTRLLERAGRCEKSKAFFLFLPPLPLAFVLPPPLPVCGDGTDMQEVEPLIKQCRHDAQS